ncbi:MAG: HAD hydrolase family protein, partial [Erysipelotrichaceae bacterium]|nr:HAD hydrolase family protein [Erysipelotrichaceae bacterium]
LIDECREKKIPWAFSPNVEKRRYSDSNEFRIATGFLDMDVKVIEDLDPNDYGQIYKVYVAADESELESLKDLPHCRYHKTYFFVEPTEKEKGIYRMMEYLKAPVEDVVVFGDGLNDLSMFRDEWTSIAMGDGAEELKEKADYVTDSAENDGIYKACRKFGWIRE